MTKVPPAPRTLIVDGVSMALYGLVMEDVTNHLSGIPVKWELSPLPGRFGKKKLATRGEIQEVQMIVSGHVGADTRALLGTNMDSLKQAMEGKELNVSFSDREDRQRMKVLLTNPDALTIPPALVQPWCAIKLGFTSPDARWHDVTETTVDFTNGAQPIVLGNVVSYGVITITGPVVAPNIAYGDLIMNFPTLSLGTGKLLVIDCWDMTITVDGLAGAHYLSDDSDFIQYDPGAGAASISINPVPALAQSVHRRAWR